MSERYTSISVCVRITDHGRGMDRKDLQRLCNRLVKSAKGGSKLRSVSAQTDPTEGGIVRAFYWANLY